MYMYMIYNTCTCTPTSERQNIFHIMFFYSYKLHNVFAIRTLAFGKLQRLYFLCVNLHPYTPIYKPKSKFKIGSKIFVKIKSENCHVIVVVLKSLNRHVIN